MLGTGSWRLGNLGLHFGSILNVPRPPWRQDENEREVKNFGSLILHAFLDVVGGDDLKSDLNHNALVGLEALLRNDVVAESDVQRVMGEISSKVSDIIDTIID